MRPVEDVAFAFDRALRAANISYALVGGLAVMAWGQPRATSDVDALVILEKPRIRDLVTALARERFSVAEADFADAIDERSYVTVFAEDSDYHVDVKIARGHDETEEVHEALDISMGDGTIRVVRAEDTIAHKLAYGTEQDVKDARSILARRRESLDWKRLNALGIRLGVAEALRKARVDVERALADSPRDGS